MDALVQMGALIRTEEDRLFGPQVRTIKEFVKQHDEGLILHSELLSGISETFIKLEG